MNNNLEFLRGILEGPLKSINYDEVSRFNKGYLRYKDNPFRSFIEDEWEFYSTTLDFYKKNAKKGASILDIGSFIPVMPLLLSKEGFNVTTIEKLSFYENALSPLLDIYESHNIKFYDQDIFTKGPVNNFSYDIVNLMNVIEHLNGSPKELFKIFYKLIKDDGFGVITVPNQARFTNRIKLLFGNSVQPQFKEFYHSDYPYLGHNREYTFNELIYALEQSSLSVEKILPIRYSSKANIYRAMLTQFSKVLPRTFQFGIFAVVKKQEGSGEKNQII